ncbi:hypothetical protein ECEC4448_6050, partial [Escherichia coli EC4448]
MIVFNYFDVKKMMKKVVFCSTSFSVTDSLQK